MIFKPITNICLNVTEACNMDCVYCFTEQHPFRMTYQVAKNAADWILHNMKISNQNGSICFFGGEPLLEWETIIVPLTKYLREEKESKIELSITSNCSLLDKEKLEFMKKYHIELLVSMDGCEETQNYNRPLKNGEKSFDVLNEKLPLIISYYPETTFRSTLIPATCHNFCKNLDYAKKVGFKNSFVIINQFEEWPEEKRKIVEKQLRQYSNYLIYCCRNNIDFIRQRTLEQAINKIVGINFQAIKNPFERIKSLDERKACGIGNGYGSINYKGDIYSCQEIPSKANEKEEFYLGNIYSGIDAKKQLTLFDKVQKNKDIYNSENPDLCKKCPIEAMCNINSCIVNNYINNKNFSAQSDNLCWWNNLLAKEAQYICKILGEEDNFLFKNYFSWILISERGNFKND